MADYARLTKAGMDMESFLKRLMGNESLVKLFVNKFASDKNFEALQEAFEEKDMKKAEMASHTLKGMCGNMSLTALFDMFTKQVNHLRAGDCGRAEQMMPEIGEAYAAAINGMKDWLSEQ